jgi:hypothetical protein
MRKVAIQTAAYLYLALAVIFSVSAVINIFDDDSTHLYVAAVLAIAAAFCGFMSVKSRTYLRMAPVPSKVQIAIGIAVSMIIGAMAGPILVVVLLIPYVLLSWAIQPRTHDA